MSGSGVMQRRVDVRGLRRSRGFTLVELVIALLILAILVAVGVPTFQDATLGSRLGSTANNLVVSLYLARSEAIKRNTIVRVCPSTDGTSCATSSSWQTGWIVMAPTRAGPLTTWSSRNSPRSAATSACCTRTQPSVPCSPRPSTCLPPASGRVAVTRPFWSAAALPTSACRSAWSASRPPGVRRSSVPRQARVPEACA